MFGAIDQSVVGTHTEQEWMDLLSMWNWRCFYCAEPVQKNSPDPKHEATKDHMVPISRGGVNFIGNIVPACLRCNQLKGDKTVDEFRHERAWVVQEKSTGNTYCRQQFENPQARTKAPILPTVEIAAMWKNVLKAIPITINATQPDSWWQERRRVLRVQAEGMKQRNRLEAAGQMTLPIFGDGSPKKSAVREEAPAPGEESCEMEADEA